MSLQSRTLILSSNIGPISYHAPKWVKDARGLKEPSTLTISSLVLDLHCFTFMRTIEWDS